MQQKAKCLYKELECSQSLLAALYIKRFGYEQKCRRLQYFEMFNCTMNKKFVCLATQKCEYVDF